MTRETMLRIAEETLAAWTAQDVERVLDCYTDDLRYLDPNTRGYVEGREAMRRYLTKLFAGWKMHWSLREAHLFEDRGGCAVLWHATFQRPGGEMTIGIDGMDFVEMRGDQIARNDVCFDRARLAQLLGAS
jgi:ketosteroid isomerase-like protein